jgi:hypothetical protein
MQLNTANKVDSDTVRILAQSLGKDRAELAKLLTDAAAAGQMLSRDPSSRESRERAKTAWNALRSMLNPNLSTAPVLPLKEAKSKLPPEEALSELDSQLRTIGLLVLTITSVQFANDSDARVREAGKALGELAVFLDDIIAGQQRRLLPDLDRLIFRL